MSITGIRAQIASGSAWSIFGELMARGAQAASYFIYAKLLLPRDFGLVGFCVVLTSISQVLVDSSLGYALIAQEDDQRTFSVIFFLDVGLSLLGIGALCLGAGWFSTILHDHRVVVVLPIMCLQVLFNALSSTHIAIARKRFEYRKLMPVRLITTAATLTVGLSLAFLGYGYWSLVYGTIAAAVGQAISAWALLGWRPTLQFDWARAKSVWDFASWAAIDMGVTWILMSSGGLFLAFFLGARDLGLFRFSSQIDLFLFGAIFSPLTPVFYSAFCKISSDMTQTSQLFGQSVKVVTMLAVAVAGVIVIFAHPLEAMIGAKWLGVGGIIALNAIADGVGYATILTPALMRAQGRQRALAAMQIPMVVGQLVVYSFAAPHGLIPFVIGKLGLEVSMYIVSSLVLVKLFKLPIGRLVGSQIVPILGASVGIAIGVGTAAALLNASGGLVSIAAGLLIFGALFCGSVYFKEPWLASYLLGLVAKQPTPAQDGS